MENELGFLRKNPLVEWFEQAENFPKYTKIEVKDLKEQIVVDFLGESVGVLEGSIPSQNFHFRIRKQLNVVLSPLANILEELKGLLPFAEVKLRDGKHFKHEHDKIFGDFGIMVKSIDIHCYHLFKILKTLRESM